MDIPSPLVLRFPWGRVWLRPERRAWLEAAGYLTASGPAEGPGRAVFHRSERRENARVEGPDGLVLFDKRLRGRNLGQARAEVGRGHRRASPAAREWRALEHARLAGLLAPEPWAAGEVVQQGMVREVFLVTRELPGVPLSDWIHDVTVDTALARAAAEDVGRAVAALHRAGIGFPELQAKHVFVAGEPGELRLGFLDLASAEVVPRIGRAARARDLGMLAATLPRRPVGRTLRLAALRAYRDAADPRWPLAHAWEQTTRAASRLCRKRRYRKFLTTSAIPPAHEEHPAQGTRIVTEERDFLEHWGGLAGLDTEGPAGWTISDRAAVFRADDDRVWREWVTLTLLRRFDVDAPRPVALRRHGPSSGLLARVLPGPQVPGFEADLAQALLDLIARVLRAGLVPEPGFLTAIVQRPDGTLALPPGVPLSQPAKVRPTDFRRALTVLRRDARTLHWPTPFLRTWMADLRAVARRSLDP